MPIVSTSAQQLLVLRGWPCKAAEKAAQLRHSWIKNEIRVMSPVDIVALHRLGSWQTLEEQFANQLQDVRQLAVDLLPAFSASGLVKSLEPLSRLTESDHAQVREVIDKRIASTWGVEVLADEMLRAAEELSASYGRLMVLWRSDSLSPADDRALADAWENLRSEAENLYSVLDRLPRGWVAP